MSKTWIKEKYKRFELLSSFSKFEKAIKRSDPLFLRDVELPGSDEPRCTLLRQLDADALVR